MVSRLGFSMRLPPMGLLGPAGLVRSLCSATSFAKNLQVRNLVPCAPALTRPADEVTRETFVKCSVPWFPTVFAFEGPRSGLSSTARSVSSRHLFTEAVEGGTSVKETVEATSDGITEETTSFTEESTTTSFIPPEIEPKIALKDLVPGATFSGTVTGIQPYGAFVSFGASSDGLVHISKLSSGFVRNVSDIVNKGDSVTVTVLDVNQASGRISLSLVSKEGDGESGDSSSREGEGGYGSRSLDDGWFSRGGVGGGGFSTMQDDPLSPSGSDWKLNRLSVAGSGFRTMQEPRTVQADDLRMVNRGSIGGGGYQTKQEEPKRPSPKMVPVAEGTVNRGIFAEGGYQTMQEAKKPREKLVQMHGVKRNMDRRVNPGMRWLECDCC